jgi:hypothetical protein
VCCWVALTPERTAVRLVSREGGQSDHGLCLFCAKLKVRFSRTYPFRRLSSDEGSKDGSTS